jgi:ribonuclease HI
MPGNIMAKYPGAGIAVDAACSGNPGWCEYQGVDLSTGHLIFRVGHGHNNQFFGTNNVAEFLAIIHALAMLKKSGRTDPVYSDSYTAISWVRRGLASTSLKDKKTMALITRAEAWLRNNISRSEVIKWETKDWGETPADYGRKK